MEIEATQVKKIMLSKLDRLDPVSIFLEDFSAGIGQITITCYGESWTSYWGSMGKDNTIADFFISCNEDYIAQNLSKISSTVVDYYEMGEAIGHEVNRDNLAFYGEQLSEEFGQDWYMEMPVKANSDYQYLCRIILAVQAGLKEYLHVS